MIELLGLLAIKVAGHGWLWRRGEKIDCDKAFGDGGPLFLIGYLVMVSPALILGIYALGWPILYWLGLVETCNLGTCPEAK